MKKFDYIILFVLNAVGMILELVAARLISPYFGNSNFVWTAIIGIILLAGSLGNLIGGRIASLKYNRLLTSYLLLFTSIYLALTPLLGSPVLSSIKDADLGVQFGSVIGSIIFFLIPATILGVITPIIMKDHIGHSKDKGKESGRITAIIAIGSLIGTFLGGFWLIPMIGTKMIFITLAVTILISATLFGVTEKIKIIRLKVIFWIIVSATAFLILVCGLTVDKTDTDIISIDTEYGRIIIEEGEYNGELIRLYKQSGAYSSATYTEPNKRFDIVFDYIKGYDEMFKFLNAKNVAMIGGAAYQYPKYFISHFIDKKMDVIEIDPMSTEIAKKYFYLDDLIDEYGEERLGLYNEDGRVFLSRCENKYDAILNDAFSGEVPVATLATKEAVRVIKNCLNPGGVYMSNVLAGITGDKSRFLRSELKTMGEVFNYVYVLPIRKNVSQDDYVNWMVVATDNESYIPKNRINIEFNGDEIILTDDYNPIEKLTSTDYFD